MPVLSTIGAFHAALFRFTFTRSGRSDSIILE